MVLPGAMPGFLLGLRFAVTSSLLALVVVEVINATSGIGHMITLASNYGQTDIIVVGLVVYALLGVIADARSGSSKGRHSHGVVRSRADPPAVRVQDLHRSFNEAGGVLNGLDLDIAPGEFVALLGRSGSGKSTLLRSLAGLDRGVAGTGRIEVPEKVSVVFQDSRLLPWKRVLDNVVLGLRAERRRRAGPLALAEVGLAGREKAWPHELSGGEQQRASLARSLVRDPQLLLADEPFGALDALTRIRMHTLLRKLCEVHQPAVLLVTHDVDEAIVLADRVIVLDDGVVRHDARIDLGGPPLGGRPGVRPAACPAAHRARGRGRPRRGPGSSTRAHLDEGRRRDPAAAPQPVHLPRRPPRGGLAATRTARPSGSSTSLLPGAGADGRGREVRRGVLRRRTGAGGQHRSRRPVPARADHRDVGDRRGHRADRPDRYGGATYNEPYNLARLFASLDHLSGGRAGWNIVTTGTPDAARNFGLDEQPAHADRYAGRDEFVEVVTKLWDSWEDDAVVADGESGTFADPDKVHPIEHVGRHFRVAGALNPRARRRDGRSRAGRLVRGRRAFAARYAEAIFTAHQTSGARRSSTPTSRRARPTPGGTPGQLLVLPGIGPPSARPRPRPGRWRRSSTS